MRHIDEVLREKEIAIEQVRQEIKALRLVCHLVDDKGDSTDITFGSDVEGQEKIDAVCLSADTADALARIRARLTDAGQEASKKENAGSGLLQFTKAALGASRTFLNRVLESPLLEREAQRKTIRDLFERLARSNAA